tara:strand:- start:2677 stop:2883 length:207 start_codon:yes stop_codon:yes gene_type:complete
MAFCEIFTCCISLLDKYLYEIQKLQSKEVKKVKEDKDQKIQSQKNKSIQITDRKIFFGPNGFPTIVKF